MAVLVSNKSIKGEPSKGKLMTFEYLYEKRSDL